MIAKLELTLNTAQTTGAKLYNESTTTEPPPMNGQQPKWGGGAGLKLILLAKSSP